VGTALTRLPTRRQILLAGATAGVAVAGGVGLVEAGALPGRARFHDALGLTGEDGVVPDVPGGPVVTGSFASAARGTTVGWTVSYPDGHRQADRLPVALLLHGRGGDHTSGLNDLRVNQYLTAAVRAGVPAFAVATVDGGPANYWHRRASGDDPHRMLVDEFVPLLGRQGLGTDRYGVFGWSMGGYGALLLAADQGVRRIAAAAALSPALWQRETETTAGSFDGPEDFARHRIRPEALRQVPLRIDCGRDDPFAAAARDLRAQVPAAGGIQRGAHTPGYWRRMLPDQLEFLGRHLSA
jgi:S-formylglutathione hydrolase FrmB